MSRLSKFSYKNDDLGDPLMCDDPMRWHSSWLTKEQLETVKKYASIDQRDSEGILPGKTV